MCGRFISTSSPADLAEEFTVDEVLVDDDTPDYNVAPRAKVMVVRQRPAKDDREERRELSRVRWGLVPSWAKDPGMGDRLINARAETIAEKPAYRRAFAKRRCIIPADGFYEWKVVAPPTSSLATPQKGRPKKQPMLIHRRDEQPMAFAGLCEVWKVPDGLEVDGAADGWLVSCAIVTTSANELLAPIHDRMPVVLPASSWDQWLDPSEQDLGFLASLLQPAADELFEVYPVSTRVNKADNNDALLLTEVPPAPTS